MESNTVSFKARREKRRRLGNARGIVESVDELDDVILKQLALNIKNHEDDKHRVPIEAIQNIFDKYPKDRTTRDFDRIDDFFYKNEFCRTLK